MKFAKPLLMLILALTLFSSMLWAEVPRYINYQGRLTDSTGNPLDTTVSMVFTIYDDSTGGNAKWSETHSSVEVAEGLFDVVLGSVDTLYDSVFNAADRFLGLAVGGNPEITPRTRVVSVAYAYRAASADTAAVALSGPIGQGGWTDDGTVVRLTTSTDNVGIGTSSPSEKLDVEGNVHADGYVSIGNSSPTDTVLRLDIAGRCDSTTPLVNLTHVTSLPWELLNPVFELYNSAYDYKPLTINGAGAIIQRRTNTKMDFDSRDNGVIVNRIAEDTTYFSGGPVGIGTKDPSQILHVAGNAHIDDTLQMRIGAASKMGLGTNEPQTALHIAGSGLAGESSIRIEDTHYAQIWNLETGANGFRLGEEGAPKALTVESATGNVGIGMDDPEHSLDIGGDLKVQTDITVHNRMNILNPGDDIIADYRLQVNGPAKIQSLTLGFDFDSGWMIINPGETLHLAHNLGGDPFEYIVIVYGKNDFGMHQANYGTNAAMAGSMGLMWSGLNGNTIKLMRGALDETGTDTDWDEVRVRIIKNQ